MDERALISDEFHQCHEQFKKLCSRPSLSTVEVSLSSWTDQLGRLRVWAGNIAAQRKDQASLDYRLRDASHIKAQIITLLRSITDQVVEVQVLLVERADIELEPDIPQSGSSSFQDEENIGADFSATLPKTIGDDLDDFSEQADDSSDLEECFQAVINAIDCLYQASMLIRTPARHDRILDSENSQGEVFRLFDQEHVSDKFPRADDAVKQRLGAAITQRRRDLESRKRHRDKLRHGLIEKEEKDGLSEALSATIATDLRKSDLKLDDTRSENGFPSSNVSQTSIGESLLHDDSTRYPALPENWTPGEGFECKYCNLPNVIIQDRVAWLKHVLKDLYPYICLFPQCSTPNLMYDSRHVWFSHILENHLNPPSELAPGIQIQKLPERIDCPLCGEHVIGTRSEKHMARHLQDLALWALPAEDIEIVDDISDDIASSIELSHPVVEDVESEDNSGAGRTDKAKTGPHFVKVRLNSSSPTQADESAHDDEPVRPKKNVPITKDIIDAENMPDIIILQHLLTNYSLNFNPYAISDGLVTIKDIRYLAAQGLCVSDPRRLELSYKGRVLKRDEDTARSAGLRHYSEVVVVIDEIPGRPLYSPDSEQSDPRNISSPRTKKKAKTDDSKPSQDTTSLANGNESAPNTSLTQVREIALRYERDWKPRCHEFLTNPPVDKKVLDREYQRLMESVIQDVITEIANIDVKSVADGDDDDGGQARREGRALLRDVEDIIEQLEYVRTLDWYS